MSRPAISTARTRKQVFELMLELNRELQTALVIVTHAPELATRMQRTLTLQRRQTVVGLKPDLQRTHFFPIADSLRALSSLRL